MIKKGKATRLSALAGSLFFQCSELNKKTQPSGRIFFWIIVCYLDPPKNSKQNQKHPTNHNLKILSICELN